MPTVHPRPLASLPTTTLPWLQLRDHFIATVGPSAGTGQPLGPLLVLADATFAPHSRFPLHQHQEMEILSVVLEGELSHRGDGADGTVVRPRGAQLISSRDGMHHAEGNETDQPVRMLQIWLEPTQHGGPAAYFARQLPAEPGRHLVAGDDVMPLRCAAKVWWVDLSASRSLEVGHQSYLLALFGPLRVGGSTFEQGEGAVLPAGTHALDAKGPASVLLIEFPV